MFKKILITSIIICVGNSYKLPAQTKSHISNTDLLANSGEPDAINNKRLDYLSDGVDLVDSKSPDNDFHIPKPYTDFRLDLLLNKDPLPPYISIDGIYKIDCVYMKGFDYYQMWETNKLNPYGFNGEHYEASQQIQLYDEEGIEFWHSPLDQTIVTSDFGLRRAVWHFGVDIRVKTGSPVFAVFDGVVRIAGYDKRGFGRFILIRHKNGLETLYGHLSKNFVKLGQEIKAGDVIGKGGNSGRSTAPHLHFEIRYSGNAIDPNILFDFKNNTIVDSKYTINQDSFAYLEEANKIRYHVIRSGDTLSGISYRYGVSINKMCHLNGIGRNSILRIGQRVRIN